jgi:hypothetical protein
MSVEQLMKSKVFISSGHDEYWDGQQRSNIEKARDAGLHLMFLSGNEVFWKIRWEDSPTVVSSIFVFLSPLLNISFFETLTEKRLCRIKWPPKTAPLPLLPPPPPLPLHTGQWFAIKRANHGPRLTPNRFYGNNYLAAPWRHF